MAATDIGVYELVSGAVRWDNISLGLPNVIVTDIEFNPALNLVYLSTFGRGIWATVLSTIDVHEIKNTVYNYGLYPNINSGNFNMKFDNNSEKNIEILDVMGKVVYTLSTKEEKINLNLNLASGAYYAKVISENKLGVKKFIVD